MKFVNLVYVLLCFTRHTFGQTNYTDRASNYVIYLSLYSTTNNISTTDLLPKVTLTDPMHVNISMVLHALFDFDEVEGNLEMSASVQLSWYDEMIQIFYNTTAYSSVYWLSANNTYNTLLVRYDKIWTPKLVLGNTVDKFSRIGDTAYMCRYDLTSGLVTWQPKFLLKSTCTPDVTYYPFDKQDCTFTILSWGYTSSEVYLQSTRDTWDLGVYEGNGEWEIQKTGSKTYNLGSQSVFELSITLKRNPLYFAFNIIIPVLAVSILNGVVFWLPVDSGERVGFSITCFLTFMVLLSTILGYLPASSGTISYLCYYVVVMMIYSGLVTGFVVLNLHIYHKEDQETVPSFLKAFIRFWRFRWLVRLFQKICQKKKHTEDEDGDSCRSDTPVIAVEQAKQETKQRHEKPKIVLSSKLLMKLESKERLSAKEAWRETGDENKKNDENVSWKDLSRFLDKFLFIAFLSTEGFFSVTFLVPLAYRQ